MNQTKNSKNQIGFIASILVIVGLVILTIWSYTFHAGLDAQTPSQEAWKKAADTIKAKYLEGDFVAIVPFWARLGEKPFVENKLKYKYVRYVSKERWPNAKRLWVVSGYDRFVDREDFIAKWAKPIESIEVSPLTIELFDMTNADYPAFDFLEHLHQAEVFVTQNGQVSPCEKWNEAEEKYACSRQHDWYYIGRETVEIDDALRKVAWAHPRNGFKAHVKYYRVKATKKVVVEHGLTQYAAQDPIGTNVYIDVLIDGKKAGTVTQENIPGWHIDEVDISKFSGDIHEIEFLIHAPADGRRHFLFSAFAK